MEKCNDLFNELKNEREMNVLFVSNNTYWSNLLTISSKYPNLKIRIHGKNTTYLEDLEKMDTIDYIIYYGNDKFSDSELLAMRKIAYTASLVQEKRVTIGYAYMNETLYDESKKINLVSFKNKAETNEITYLEEDNLPIDLLQLAVNFNDSLEKQKCIKKNLKRSFVCPRTDNYF